MTTLKLLLVFVLMMILLWRKKPLAQVVIASSVLLALLCGTGPAVFFRWSGKQLIVRPH